MSNQTTLRRRLDPEAVARARLWSAKRLKELAVKPVLSLTNKERHQLTNLRADRDRRNDLDYRNPNLNRQQVTDNAVKLLKEGSS